MRFEVKLNGVAHTFFVRAPGRHNACNALFAIAVAHRLGCSPATIQSGLRTYQKPGRRLITYRLRNGIKLLDDSYSANPNAMRAAIDVLSTIGKGTNVAVLGSMLEMGPY
ncbi:hypothetical protein MXD63_41620, partial [Frankia sp. Cpl3]|nr:hypothetical protein [Frankia sp. Cpl3]